MYNRRLNLKACLISNRFLNTSKYSEMNQWLIHAAEKKNIELISLTNDQCLVELGQGSKCFLKEYNPEFIIFWDKDIRLAKSLELEGYRLYNNSDAIEKCDDKSYTHLILQEAGITTPKTIIAPKTFDTVGYNNLDFLSHVIHKLGFPMIIKECYGSFGQQVYLINNEKECIDKVKQLAGKPLLFQEFIKSSFARDIRLQVVGNQVIAAMFRYSDTGDFRANVSNGGRMRNYIPSEEQIQIAIDCCKALKLDFAGIDLLFSEEEKPIVCEVNSNAHFKNIYDCTGVNAADYIMDYIIEQQIKGV